MSRGLGTMQRDILRAYATARPDARGMPRVTGRERPTITGRCIRPGSCVSMWSPCAAAGARPPAIRLPNWPFTPLSRRHTPHIEYAVVGWGFDVSFARRPTPWSSVGYWLQSRVMGRRFGSIAGDTSAMWCVVSVNLQCMNT